MAIPPFNELRLKPGEKPTPQRLGELFEGYMRNFEDAYENFASVTQLRETKTAVEAKRTVVGAVTGAGVIIAGSGFSASRSALGTYSITLTTELTTVGVMVATQIGGALPAVMIVGTPVKKVFVLESYKASSTTLEKVDSAFTFNIRQI